MSVYTINNQKKSINSTLVKPQGIARDYTICNYQVSLYGSFYSLNRCRYPTIAKHGSQPGRIVSLINDSYLTLNK